MKKHLRLSLILSVILVVSVLLSGCGEGNSDTSEVQLNISGSTAMQPLIEAIAEKYMHENTNATVHVNGGGSGNGINQVFSGVVDIGNSDVYAEEKIDKEQAEKLVDHKVCVVAMAAVVNNKVGVDGLTTDQLIDIFTGKIKNWSQVGGNDIEIVVINRPKSSGTRAVFNMYALDGNDEIESLTGDSNGAIKQTVSTTEGAISYLAFSYLGDDMVKPLKLNGVEPIVENVKTGDYNVWAYAHMYTLGEPNEGSKNFIDYVKSENASDIISELGYIPEIEMQVQR